MFVKVDRPCKCSPEKDCMPVLLVVKGVET